MIVSCTVESNKYSMSSLTLRYSNPPTRNQIISDAKKLAKCTNIQPNFKDKNFEIHITTDGELSKVQFYPSVYKSIKVEHLK